MTQLWGGARAQAARRRLAPLVASGRAVCRRCNQPILPTDSWDVGHLVDIAEGGHPGGRVEPEHSRCNRSSGGRLGQARRAARSSRVRDWLATFSRAGASKEPLVPSFSPPAQNRFAPIGPDSQLIYEVGN